MTHAAGALMGTTAERNRKLKAVLVAEFGRGNVVVRGARGTAYGWVQVRVTVPDLANRPGVRSRVWELVKEHGIEIGTYGYNDPGSDYGFGSKLSLDFVDAADAERRDQEVRAVKWTYIASAPDGRELARESGGRDAEARMQGVVARFNMHLPRGAKLASVRTLPSERP
jgi:hypothetical protein